MSFTGTDLTRKQNGVANRKIPRQSTPDALGRGIIERASVDTAHFKGNHPDRAEIRATNVCDVVDIRAQSEHWPVLLPETKLAADSVHSFADEVLDAGCVSHVRLNIFPDGGVSRLRLFAAQLFLEAFHELALVR